jgi:hypothetical protein
VGHRLAALRGARSKGRFAAQATDAVIGLGLVLDAIARGSSQATTAHEPDADDDAREPLYVGLDVARFGDDETVADAAPRPKRIYPLIALPAGRRARHRRLR